MCSQCATIVSAIKHCTACMTFVCIGRTIRHKAKSRKYVYVHHRYDSILYTQFLLSVYRLSFPKGQKRYTQTENSKAGHAHRRQFNVYIRHNISTYVHNLLEYTYSVFGGRRRIVKLPSRRQLQARACVVVHTGPFPSMYKYAHMLHSCVDLSSLHQPSPRHSQPANQPCG